MEEDDLELRKSGSEEQARGVLSDGGLTSEIIHAAITVHRAMGPGFVESFYEEALCLELQARNIPFERQKSISVVYRGKVIGEHRLDLLVDARVVVELKAVKELGPIHFSIVRSYMKAIPVVTGLLMNFAAMPLTIKRVGREQSAYS
jgi:GxxExxY protein